MTDNREVVAYGIEDSDSKGLWAAEVNPRLAKMRAEDYDDAVIPLVPQSLLLAAREDASAASHLAASFLLRAERAEAELAECRRDAVRYRWIVSALEIPDSVHQGIFLSDKPMTDAAIDACVGGEEG